MRKVNTQCFAAPYSGTTDGAAIDCTNLASLSFAISFGDDHGFGTLKLQASNDPSSSPTNWVDIPTQTATGSGALLTIPQASYRWVRPVFIGGAAGEQTIATIAAGYGANQIFTVTPVDDVAGSLNSTYWLFYATNNSPAYYVWYSVDNAGVDPALPGKTGVKVSIAANATADDIAIATDAALNGSTAATYFTIGYSSGLVYLIALTQGTATDASDGAQATGFSIVVTQSGAEGQAVQIPAGSYFLIDAAITDGGTQYYVWITVDGNGDDPLLPGRTGIECDIGGADPADEVAIEIGGVIEATGDFTIASRVDNVIKIVNKSIGAFTPASDVNTGFLIQIIPATVNMEGLGV